MSYQIRIVFLVCVGAVVCCLEGALTQERLHGFFVPPATAVAQIPVAPLVRLKAGAEQSEPPLSSQAALLIDEASGGILYARNADAPLPPASTTKLMTVLVAREVYPVGSILTVPSLTTIGGTKVGVIPGAQYTVESIIEAALITSGNDAAYTLAANAPGGTAAFVEKMNHKAREINLSTAAFVNPTGFDAPLLRMSANDLSILTREVMKDSLLKAIVATQQTTITDVTGKRSHVLRTTNHLLGTDERVVGVKTGTTEEAGQVLVSAFVIEGRTLLCIVMGSQDRYKDTQALIDWAARAYEWVPFEQTMVY